MEFLRSHEKGFKKIADMISQLIWFADSQGNIFWFNKTWHDYTGLSSQESRGVGWHQVLHPNQLQEVLTSFKQAIAKNKRWESVFLMRGARGEYRWFLTKADPLRDENDKHICWIGVNTEVHRQKMIEDQLSKSRMRYKLATLATKDIIWDYDILKQKVHWNRSLITELKFSHPKSFTHIDWWKKHIHPDDRKRVTDSLEKAIEEGRTQWRGEYRFYRGDGKLVALLDRGYIVKDESGRAVRMLGAMMDVTPQHERYETLKNEKVSAVQASKEKSTFLANISHELRTPLSAILGFVELIRLSDYDVKQTKEFMKVIERNCTQLQRIIDDVLDLSRIEAGKLAIQRVMFNFDQMVEDVSKQVQHWASKKNLQFRMSSHVDFKGDVYSDPTRLKQIMLNMLGNAVKFTHKGHVHLDLRMRGHELFIRVSDTGIGIAKKNRADIFETFHQADESNSRNYGGAGLGLSLTKRIAQAMGGDFYLLQSEEGKGSVFEAKVTLERPTIKEYADQIELNPPSEKRLQGLSGLIVDDSEDNRAFLFTLLRKFHVDCDIVADGKQALEHFEKGKYDFVLLDIQMPGMDGYRVIRRLKAINPQVPIIALTAHAMEEEKQRAIKAGFADFLRKPISSRKLMGALQKNTLNALN